MHTDAYINWLQDAGATCLYLGFQKKKERNAVAGPVFREP